MEYEETDEGLVMYLDHDSESLEGHEFRDGIHKIALKHYPYSLKDIMLPNTLQILHVHGALHSFAGVILPEGLQTIIYANLTFDPIKDVVFPSTIKTIKITESPTTSINSLPINLEILIIDKADVDAISLPKTLKRISLVGRWREHKTLSRLQSVPETCIIDFGNYVNFDPLEKCYAKQYY
ncbi:MAG: hypothetical protein Gaeavirus27_2 [Gaeavirus sp.]|uniref:FNIP repeat-containing protein n=1 Tax=Gaeavirus sp. TaxID=2487767 RepID=A0A3G4ZZA6_9VIRU|nr:MAG: hypothetical protein Gaeavirus27_2 [Gaeavirus sp.]